VPVDPRLDVILTLELGVTLGGAVTDELEDGAMEPETVELVRGKGERGWSELVPVEPKLEVMFALALGVILGGAVTEEFEDTIIEALILARDVELVRGKGERGWSELVPVEPKLEVMFALALGVILGGAVTEEFEDAIIEALILAGDVELVNGKGERG
jgi:cyanate lyase